MLVTRQNDHAYSVPRTLLDLAVENDEIPPLDTAALSRVLAGLDWFFSELSCHGQPVELDAPRALPSLD